ncbi:Hypothetical protein A7982_01580 [Minicystis rosea]|nr:Hypothetical protein A7982_01580 [Minicystis rosea]
MAVVLAPSAARAGDKLACVAAVEAAQTLRSEGKLKAAREDFIRCAQTTCPKIVRDDCAAGLREVESELPSIVVRARDGDGNDLLDVHVDAGATRLADHLEGQALTLDPGAVKLRLDAGGFSPKEVQLVIARGEKMRTVIVLLERAPATPTSARVTPRAEVSSPAPWILLGVGAVSLGAFGVLQGVAQSEYADIKAGCGVTRSCTEDTVAPTRSKFIASGVAMGVGLASIAAAATLWIVSSSPHKTGAAARTGLAISPTGVALHGSF